MDVWLWDRSLRTFKNMQRLEFSPHPKFHYDFWWNCRCDEFLVELWMWWEWEVGGIADVVRMTDFVFHNFRFVFSAAFGLATHYYEWGVRPANTSLKKWYYDEKLWCLQESIPKVSLEDVFLLSFLSSFQYLNYPNPLKVRVRAYFWKFACQYLLVLATYPFSKNEYDFRN